MPSDKCEKCERLLKACEAVLPFARTQSCVYMDGSDCPDPGHDHMTHCCDWGPLVEQLTEAIRQAGGSLEAWTEEVRGTYQLESQIASLTAANSRLEAELAQAREREAGLREALAAKADEWVSRMDGAHVDAQSAFWDCQAEIKTILASVPQAREEAQP
jgi:hypothetical protein